MNYSYEEAYEKLAAIVTKLQSEETTLEEAISLYEQGVLLQKHLETLLQEANDKVVNILNEDGSITPFIHEKDQEK